MNPDSLYDFQVEAKDFIESARPTVFGTTVPANWGLALHEMGLGKTAIALETIQKLVEAGKRILIIAPGKTKIQWQKQFDKWVLENEIDEFNITSLYSIKGSKQAIPKDCSCVMSHALLAKKVVIEKLAAANFDGIVIDEIHKFGGEGTKRIKHLWALINLTESRFADCRIGLSGTPVRNWAKEIINVAKFVDFPPARNAEEFSRRYLTYDRKALYDPNKFHKDFSPYYIRRTVAEVQKSLPSIRRTELYTEITNPTLVKMYNREVSLMENFVNNSQSVSTFSLLGYLVRMRHYTGLAKAAEPSIIEPILEYLTEGEEPKKVVLGIHHHLVAKRLENSILGRCKHCGERRMSHFEIDETTFAELPISNKYGCNGLKYTSKIPFFKMGIGLGDKESEAQKNKFIECEAPAIMLLSVKAAGEGVDGLQYAAHKMYIFEPQWNMAEIKQAEKRIHRTGQKYPCQVEYTIAVGTVDEFFWELSKVKDRVAVQVEDENFTTNPSFLRTLAEKVIANRLPTPVRDEDLEEFERIIAPKEEILENLDMAGFEV